ncbi:BREX-1 system adenine-specific DNA-methyltransferase PglX [Levilactobacillus hammesii]|uniref:site-specific DNA-methyltransferase (adenine-specific) n=1 Tax=Levilactobacillus hammesii DSM 16381 TaxID=1423753 RepID=A0A0R1UNB9_9LACO|nr:BREX-1 system adenine-specific DNA-methyltransferase PglX [Levilactobacillus hammesii]KRL94340.1 restriction enzyme [Levilactobacillus hammesii DSM 16381]
MDKTAIKRFAIDARRSLIKGIQLKAAMLGITSEGVSKKLPISTSEIEYYVDDQNGITGHDIIKRQKLVAELQQRARKNDFATAFNDLVEEVAYTWFNRIIAIRFMEVNDYLPSQIRVLSSTENRNVPDIMLNTGDVEEYLGGFTSAEQALIDRALDTEQPSDTDAEYQMLFIKQANALHKNLPYLFETTNDYAELLFTPNYHDGVIQHLITDISEDDFNVAVGGQVEIIGWLYQYYNTEPKDTVIGMPKSHKFRDTEIASATQIFTPDWIVKYMVQNSLGKYWIKHRLAVDNSQSEMDIANEFNWQYYMTDAKQPQSVQDNLDSHDDTLKTLEVTSLKMIDPSMGSGHILVYAFDVFMQIYTSEGYSRRDAAENIVKYNLNGLDIDTRAFQLSYFAVMMKARQYNRRTLTQINHMNVYDIPGTDDLRLEDFDILLVQLSDTSHELLHKLLEDFTYGNELGSLISEDGLTLTQLHKELSALNQNQLSFELIPLLDKVKVILDSAELLSQKYQVIITNPPYMGSSRMGENLTKFAKKNYPNAKSDLFAMFIERWNKALLPGGYNAMVTMQSWMFLSSFEKMRINLLKKYTISNLMHMENNVMGIAFGTAVTIVRNCQLVGFVGTYHQIKTADASGRIPHNLPIAGNRFNRTNQANFAKIPGMPIAYWASENLLSAFTRGTSLSNISETRQGLATSNNNRFLRHWHEIEYSLIGLGFSSSVDASHSNKKWFPYNKGGAFRRWYGNQDYVINYENDGAELKGYAASLYKSFTRTIKSISKYFEPSISWSKISSGQAAFRYFPKGFIFDVAGTSIYSESEESRIFLLAFLNSKVATQIMSFISPTLNYEAGQVAILPVIKSSNTSIATLTKDNMHQSAMDWNSFETSWDFTHHPLLAHIADDKRNEVNGKLKNAFGLWQLEAKDRFDQLKSNEEELNRIFIDLYGLNDELTPEVADKDVSVRLADEVRDIKSFLSYFVGVVFGRYSLDIEGLAFAGGEWDQSKYQTFVPNEDNLLMLNDADYFGDSRDIINRLKVFLTATFGAETVAENIAYIAGVVGKKADTDEAAIRRYFVEDFFKDHKKIYQKRPIYWEFNSGKANGFKALMYLHRYDSDELAMIRTNYLHPLQGKYELRIDQLTQLANDETVTSQKKRYEKTLKHLNQQLSEIIKYDPLIQHIANQKIELDLDDGVVVNYDKLQDGNTILSKLK